MAKGYQANAERNQALQALGRQLARRSKSRCELCGEGGLALAPTEVEPAPDDPDVEHTVFICAACRDAIARPDSARGQHWRCLVDRLWSDLPASQVLALRLLEHLASREDWAGEALDLFDPDPELRRWADATGH
jgi:protein PhnA